MVYKKVFLEISQNSQESACARVYFLIELQAETLANVFSHEFCEIFMKTFSTEQLLVIASETSSWKKPQLEIPASP